MGVKSETEGMMKTDKALSGDVNGKEGNVP
jgi:uncharacterized protein YoxC